MLESDIASLQRYNTPHRTSLYEDPANTPLVPLTGDLSRQATKAELDARMLGLRSTILDEIQRAIANRLPPTKALAKQTLTVARNQPFQWNSPADSVPYAISIRNPGPDTITGLRIYVDGRTSPSTIEEIIESATSGAETTRELAVALWDFLKNNRVHDWPPHSGRETFDPVKLVSIYGYGFCSHAAKALAILAHHAGLESRVRHAKSQHVVCEILIDGEWAMFDPDGEVYYTKEDGQIASVDEIRANPDLVSTAKSPIYPEAKLRDIYAHHDFLITPYENFGEITPHGMQVTLRPGEGIEYSKQKKGLFLASRYLESPREYSNGTWFFSPAWHSITELPNGMVLENLSSGAPDSAHPLQVIDPELPASITTSFALPYPILRAIVVFQGNHQESKFDVRVSRDGRDWIGASPFLGDDKTQFNFKDFPRRLVGDPDYSCWVKLIFPVGQDRIPDFNIVMDLQMAPRSLPLPDSNTGSIVLSYEAEDDNRLDVTLITKGK